MLMRDFIFDDTEGKCLALDQKTTLSIVNDIEKKYNIKLNFDLNCDYIFKLLLSDYRNDVKELLKKYGYNPEELIFSIISLLCINSETFDNNYVNILKSFYSNYNLNKINKDYILESEKGILLFKRFTDSIDDHILIELVRSGMCLHRCHSLGDSLYKRFDNSIIVTSQMPGRFGSNYFHTYFITENNKVIDIANNGVFSKEGYYNYFQPQEIISYPGEELEERFEKIKEHSTDAKTLQLALEKMKERY